MTTQAALQTPASSTAYDDTFIDRLELIWGEGMLSPGGADELREILSDQDLKGTTLLDVGCGTGGYDLLLLRDHGVGQLTGIDLEAPVLERARTLVAAAGFARNSFFQQVEPGPLPFADGTFDVVFSKDAIIHVPDKQAIYREILRVLKPGGRFIGCDWLRGPGHDSAEIFEKLNANGMAFNGVSLEESRVALDTAGFAAVTLHDRGSWYQGETRRELERAQGPLRDRAIALLGQEAYEGWIALRRRFCDLATAGHLRPTHIFAKRPSKSSCEPQLEKEHRHGLRRLETEGEASGRL